jgi:hypothetical protein
MPVPPEDKPNGQTVHETVDHFFRRGSGGRAITATKIFSPVFVVTSVTNGTYFPLVQL